MLVICFIANQPVEILMLHCCNNSRKSYKNILLHCKTVFGGTLCLVTHCHWAIRFFLKVWWTPFMQRSSPSHVSKANLRVISEAFPSILSIPCMWLAGSFCREAFALVPLPGIALLCPDCRCRTGILDPFLWFSAYCGWCKYANPQCS